MKKIATKEKVLIGFNGDLDSCVAAYLLKKQGYEVIAIGINFANADDDGRALYGKDGEVLPRAPFFGSYVIESLEKVKASADQLQIQFYAVDAAKEYKYFVTDVLVASRLGGIFCCTKVRATELIFRVLHKKMEVLGASFISTGHYAKIIKNQITGFYNLFSSNNLEYDQSFCVSSVSQEILSKVILPLSEVGKDEVIRISKMINFKMSDAKQIDPFKISGNDQFEKFLYERLAHSLVKEGAIVDYRNDSIIADHHGGIHYYPGQKSLKTKLGGTLDKGLEVVEVIYPVGTVYVVQEDSLKTDYIHLTGMVFDESQDITKPIEVFLKYDQEVEKIQGIFYPKSNHNGFIELKVRLGKSIPKGSCCVLYNKKGIGGKVFAYGYNELSGWLDKGAINRYPEKYSEMDDDNDKEEIRDIFKITF